MVSLFVRFEICSEEQEIMLYDFQLENNVIEAVTFFV